MANLDLIIAAWEVSHWEFTLAFEGLSDENLWKRPHPTLLSIGELAGHVAYYDAVRFTGPGPDTKPDLSLVKVQSPLIDARFTYYLANINEPVVLNLTTAEVVAELKRINDEAKAVIASEARDSDDKIPGFPDDTWGKTLEYQIFHVAYHTGQAYSVRHLLGDTPPDN
ncbi:hypothetical protein BH11ARM1_BH11ARM1_08590 [soil metagenome]